MTGLADGIRRSLRERADPSRAAGRQAYMKSAMPFRGVPVPETRRIARTATTGVTDAATLLDLASELWDEAEFREERYAALAVLAARPLVGDSLTLALAERMVRSGQWWDYVDELAHRVAESLDADPGTTSAIVRRWAVDDDLWIRRLAILSQLQRGHRVDESLLAEVIERNLGDAEFFIRKAIGWALRDHARTDPEWVRTFVESHDMAPLSRREALRHL